MKANYVSQVNMMIQDELFCPYEFFGYEAKKFYLLLNTVVCTKLKVLEEKGDKRSESKERLVALHNKYKAAKLLRKTDLSVMH